MSKENIKTYADSIGIASLAISDLHKVILSILHAGSVPCLHGEAGIGKTAAAGQIADSLSAVLIANTVSHMQAADFGIPFRDPSNPNFFKMLLPPWAEKIFEAEKQGKPSLVFFDEITRYPDAETASGLFNFISERSLYGKKIPDNCYIMAACNPDNGSYQVNDILNDPAWRRRLCHIEATTDIAGWLRYASERGFHEWVRDYVSAHIDHLLDEKARALGKIYATPASWEKVSNYLFTNENSLNIVALASYVGYGVADNFIQYTTNSEFKLTPKTILYDWEEALKVMKKIDEKGRKDLYTKIVTSLCLYIHSEKPDPKKVAGNILLLLDRVTSEVKVNLVQQLNAANANAVEEDAYTSELMLEITTDKKIWDARVYDEVKHCMG